MKSESGVTAATKAVVASNAAHALVRVVPRGKSAEAFVTVFMIEAVLPAALQRPARTNEASVPRPISNAAATICISPTPDKHTSPAGYCYMRDCKSFVVLVLRRSYGLRDAGAAQSAIVIQITQPMNGFSYRRVHHA
ncbi:MAG: hypothetical protein ABI192_15145 [Bradyrhizobium sp.]